MGPRNANETRKRLYLSCIAIQSADASDTDIGS